MFKVKAIFLCAVISTLSHQAVAVIYNGPLAHKSDVTIDVDFSVPGNGATGSIMISRLNKVSFGTFTGTETTADLKRIERFCVYRVGNQSKFNFYITADSKNGSGQFELVKNGTSYPSTNQKVKYTVAYSSNVHIIQTGEGSVVALNDNTRKGVFADDAVSLVNRTTCSGDNVALVVVPVIIDAMNAESGTYSDELTLTVSPR